MNNKLKSGLSIIGFANFNETRFSAIQTECHNYNTPQGENRNWKSKKGSLRIFTNKHVNSNKSSQDKITEIFSNKPIYLNYNASYDKYDIFLNSIKEIYGSDNLKRQLLPNDLFSSHFKGELKLFTYEKTVDSEGYKKCGCSLNIESINTPSVYTLSPAIFNNAPFKLVPNVKEEIGVNDKEILVDNEICKKALKVWEQKTDVRINVCENQQKIIKRTFLPSDCEFFSNENHTVSGILHNSEISDNKFINEILQKFSVLGHELFAYVGNPTPFDVSETILPEQVSKDIRIFFISPHEGLHTKDKFERVFITNAIMFKNKDLKTLVLIDKEEFESIFFPLITEDNEKKEDTNDMREVLARCR